MLVDTLNIYIKNPLITIFEEVTFELNGNLHEFSFQFSVCFYNYLTLLFIYLLPIVNLAANLCIYPLG